MVEYCLNFVKSVFYQVQQQILEFRLIFEIYIYCYHNF